MVAVDLLWYEYMCGWSSSPSAMSSCFPIEKQHCAISTKEREGKVVDCIKNEMPSKYILLLTLQYPDSAQDAFHMSAAKRKMLLHTVLLSSNEYKNAPTIKYWKYIII